MFPIGDELGGNPISIQDCSYHSRFPVKKTAHGVEKVCGVGDAFIETVQGLAVGCIGVADGGNKASFNQLGNELQLGFDFGRDGNDNFQAAQIFVKRTGWA